MFQTQHIPRFSFIFISICRLQSMWRLIKYSLRWKRGPTTTRIECRSFKGRGPKRPNTFDITAMLRVIHIIYDVYIIIIIGPKAWHFFCSPSSAESKHEKSVTSTNYLIQKCSILFYSKRKNTHRSSNTDHKYKYREHRAWALCQNPSHIAKSLGGNTSEWAIETNQICSFMWWRHSI